MMETFLDEASVRNLDVECIQAITRPPYFTNYTGAGQR